MADELAKIGLDTTDISRALDRISGQLDKVLGGAAKKADKEVNTLSRSLKAMGTAVKSYFGFQGLQAGIQSITNLNERIEETRSKLVAGSKESKDFEASIEGMGKNQANVFHQASRFMDNLILKTTSFFAKSALGWGMMFGAVKPEDVFKEGNDSGRKDINALEDEAASFAEQRSGSEEDRIKAMQKEVEIQAMLAEYYSQGAGMDREKMNSAKARFGDLTRELYAAEESNRLAEEAAKATRQNLEFSRAGLPHVGAQQKIIADFEERIARARKEGRKELEAQLIAQRNIAVEDAKLARVRETPATRREKRKEARIRERDINRDDARQEEFRIRTWRGARGQRGSPLAEFQAGVKPPDAAKGVVTIGGEALEYMKATATNTKASLVVSVGGGG